MDFLFIYFFSSPARRGVQKLRMRCNLHGRLPQLALVQFLIGGIFEMLVKRKRREEAAGSLPQGRCCMSAGARCGVDALVWPAGGALIWFHCHLQTRASEST